MQVPLLWEQAQGLARSWAAAHPELDSESLTDAALAVSLAVSQYTPDQGPLQDWVDTYTRWYQARANRRVPRPLAEVC